MKLTALQKEQLAAHLAKKPIKYIELYNELYDHYATAYEDGDQSFEDTLSTLDALFPYQKLKNIDASLPGKAKKTLREIFWTEFKQFWYWPQILASLGVLFLGVILIQSVPIDSIIMFVLTPMLLSIIILSFYAYFLGRGKKYGHKKFKSAHQKAIDYYFRLLFNIYNLSIFLPIVALGPYQEKIISYQRYSIIIFFLLIIFLVSSIIGFKVIRTKIRIQYL